MGTNVDNLMESTMNKIKGMADVDTVIGSKIIINSNITIIPISKISYAFGAAGSDLSPKKNDQINDKVLFGGGGGSGMSIVPIGFLVISNDNVKFLQADSFNGPLDRAISMAPEAINKIKSMFDKNKNKNKNDFDKCDKKD